MDQVVQVTEEAMAQVRGTSRDGGRLYADIFRERRVSTANRFEVLQGEKKRDEVIYIGDSIMRKIDRTVCRGRKEKTTTVCLPGARVDDVRKRVGQVTGPATGGGGGGGGGGEGVDLCARGDERRGQGRNDNDRG